MKDLEKQLASLVEKAIKVAEATGEFAIEQAPLLLQEFYRWHLVKNVFTVIVFVTLIIVAWKMFKAFGEKKEPQDFGQYDCDYVKIGSYYYPGFGGPFTFIVLMIGSVICAGIALQGLYNFLFIAVSPKLYLIEYFVK